VVNLRGPRAALAFVTARRDVRLLPALMITAGVVLGLKAVALAEAAEQAAGETPAPASEAAAPAPAAASKASGEQCPAPSFAEQAGLSATEVEVLQSLGARRTALDQRQAELSTQAQLVAASEKRVDERLTELKRVQTAVEGILGKLDEEQNARVNGLVTVYSKMKPKDAAKIWEGLDEAVLIEVASRMKQATLAEVMGLMNAESARKLTKSLMDSKKVPDDALTKVGAASPAKAG
jgi:flagellar motility protein MotE (MotC chaperone)